MSTITCPDCGKDYEQIANHWQFNPDHRNTLTERQHQIVQGLVLGDGHIHNQAVNSKLIVGSTSRSFLEWLQEQFPVISGDVRVSKSVDELIEMNEKNSHVDVSVTDADYSKMYRWNTVSHPDLNEYTNTHESVDVLTPLSTKVWYVSDGTLAESGTSWRPQFRVTDDERLSYVAGLLRDVGFTVTESSGNCYIKQGETEQFFEYIGEPIPSFDDKWV